MMNNDWGAAKLPLSYDARRLTEEVRQIEDINWGLNGRTSKAFVDTQAIFLKGYAAAEGNPSCEEREILSQLPYLKTLIYSLIPSSPQKCVLSYLPPKTDVGLHVDLGDYFNKTVRVHFPVTTNNKVTMYFGGCYHMKPGEVWILNNCALHGVENAHKTKPRIHLICDYLPTPELMTLFDNSNKTLAKQSPKLHEKLQAKTR